MTGEELLKTLVAVGILTEDEARAAGGEATKDAQDLFARLVRAGKLTQFQATQVLAGKVKALVLGDYVIVDRIGAGGMGQVFKAEHRRMERIVAIKLLSPTALKDVNSVKRFEREVEAAAKLMHPNIVTAYDAGEAQGRHYLVMEFVAGRDLSATVKKRGPLPVDEAVNYVRQAACGLAYAHSKGVVHRDIKPANLLVDADGTLKILDMGLARFDDQEAAVSAGLTQSGQVMGTVDFMAPEQAFDTRHADARADIYSLGCSLYQLLVGEHVYGGESLLQKFMAHREAPIPDLRAKLPEVSRQLDTIFHRMVAKKPEDRFQTMNEVVAALEDYRAASGSPATVASMHRLDVTLQPQPKMPANRQASTPAPSRRYLWLAGGAATAVLVLLGAWLVAANSRARNQVAGDARSGPASAKAIVTPTAKESASSAKPVSAASETKAKGNEASPGRAIAPFDARQARAHQEAWARHLNTKVEMPNSLGAKMILVPPGEFLMGSTPEQNELGVKMAATAEQNPRDRASTYLKDELPQHRVAISKPFWLAATEVTAGQFKQFVDATGYQTEAEKFGFGNSGGIKAEYGTPAQSKINWRTPGYPVTEDLPVSEVTWADAAAFCKWLSEKEKATYRLPTEAEWEYACRAGTTTQFFFGDDPAMLARYAWFKGNSGGSPQAAGLKAANPFGLFDMHGSVYEWCQDLYLADYYSKSPPSDPAGPTAGYRRAMRGGNRGRLAAYCRSAFRYAHEPTYRQNYSGFRIARSQ